MSLGDFKRARLNLATALMAILTALIDEIARGRLGRDIVTYMLLGAAASVIGAWVNVKK